ncbi:anti-sigma factor [Dactylosporangium sp. NPDC049742]|uniref:anti-sigma factor n=1 Tax=Dactylosporangium sp. NPDC049742 TaxID=3154737 RepID=UPI0034422F7B
MVAPTVTPAEPDTGSADRGPAGETDHLDHCPQCRTDLDQLRHVAREGRHMQTLRDLPMPPQRVWDRIEAELAATGRGSAPPAVTLHTDPPPARRSPTARAADEVAARRARRRGPGWAMTALIAGVAAALAVFATLVATDRPAPAPQAVPCAGVTQIRLEALPGVTGSACLRTVDGQRRLHIHAQGMPTQTGGDYEAWLLDATSLNGPTLRMEALGVLVDGSDQDLPVPTGLNLEHYSIIDISAEPHDGNAAHSGHSLLRGTLR